MAKRDKHRRRLFQDPPGAPPADAADKAAPGVMSPSTDEATPQGEEGNATTSPSCPAAEAAPPTDESSALALSLRQAATSNVIAVPSITLVEPPKQVAADEGSDDWPQRQWPEGAGPREEGFQVCFKRSTLNEIHRHGKAEQKVEVCGVLVGTIHRDEHGPFLMVDACVRGNGATSRNAQVTFTAETWDHIHGHMEKRHPDKRIVGWYHTHPSHGIFLSDMDLFIHGHFFNLMWQVAFVYDPNSGEEGLFVWRDGKTVKETYAVEEDAPKEDGTPLMSPQAVAGVLARVSDRLVQVERRQKVMLAALVVVLVAAAAWPFVLFNLLQGQRRPIAVQQSQTSRQPQPPAATVSPAPPQPTASAQTQQPQVQLSQPAVVPAVTAAPPLVLPTRTTTPAAQGQAEPPAATAAASAAGEAVRAAAPTTAAVEASAPIPAARVEQSRPPMQPEQPAADPVANQPQVIRPPATITNQRGGGPKIIEVQQDPPNP